MKKILVGLSGGVDSATTAFLLLEQGYEVIGVTFQFHQDEAAFNKAFADAEAVAKKLGIEHYAMDVREKFQKEVMDYFVDSYLKGETPNPCPRCNAEMKLKIMWQEAQKKGIDKIATGHYALLKETTKGRRLFQIPGNPKSQEYFLALVGDEILNMLEMPLARYQKDEVRKIAEGAGLPVSGKKDSQEICFIPDENYVQFIEDYRGISTKKGNLVTREGKVVGQHEGFYRYTIGQRRGIGVGLGKPQYVIETRPKENEVVIGDKEFVNQKQIGVILEREFETLEAGQNIKVKIRYKSPSQGCKILRREEGRLVIEADDFFGAATSGQLAVFYDEEGMVLGAGDIEKQN